MAGMEDDELYYHMRDEAELRQWVEANPGRVNEMVKDGHDKD
jgi:hypothetical protein